MMNYIEKDSTIDFKRLEADLEINKTNLLSTIISILNDISSGLLDYLKSSRYEVEGRSLSYQEVKPIIESQMKAPKEDAYHFETSFWTDFLTMALEHASKRNDMIQHIEKSKLKALNSLYSYFNIGKIDSIEEHRKNLLKIINLDYKKK